MTADETNTLIKHINAENKDSGNFAYKYVQVLPFIVLNFTGFALNLNTLYEWIQHYEQSRIFSNGTLSESSECGVKNKSDPDYSLYQRVESETAKWQMYAGIGWYIPAIISTSVLPAYSDCFGRKFILTIGCIGSLIKAFAVTIIIYFNLHPAYVLVASIAEGCTGSFFSTSSGLFSFVADLTEAGRRRTIGMTVLDGSVLICITLGTLGTGYFIQWTNFFIVSVTSCGMVLASAMFIVICVPETFPKYKRSKSRSFCAVFKRTFAFYISDAFKQKRFAYVLLLTAYVLENIANGHRTALEILYQLGRPFCWSLDKIGLFSALRHVAQGLAGLFFVKPLQRCFSDLTITILSLVFCAGSFVLEAVAQTDLMMYMGKM